MLQRSSCISFILLFFFLSYVSCGAPYSSPLASIRSSGPSNILLDSAILYWVLIPICLVMVMQGVLRQYVSVLLKDDKRPGSNPLVSKQSIIDRVAISLLLGRSQRLRTAAKYINGASFKMRKKYLTQSFDEAPKPDENGGDDQNPAMPGGDPMAMMGMMKQNFAMMVPNMILMGWVSYFFSGFVLVKLPFGLSDRFKQLTQRGISLNSLDVSYVSSLSWYFLNLFGLRGLFTLLLGEGSGAVDDPNAMAMGMAMPMGNPMGMPGTNAAAEQQKMFKQELNELEIVQHEFAVANAEKRLIAMNP